MTPAWDPKQSSILIIWICYSLVHHQLTSDFAHRSVGFFICWDRGYRILAGISRPTYHCIRTLFSPNPPTRVRRFRHTVKYGGGFRKHVTQQADRIQTNFYTPYVWTSDFAHRSVVFFICWITYWSLATGSWLPDPGWQIQANSSLHSEPILPRASDTCALVQAYS